VKVSLIISVYKNVRDLEVVLEGLKFQSFKEFEIIISEDGESEDMHNFVRAYKHPNKIIHLTQADVGWRKNKALNNAIRKSSGDYLVFIDGDCVLHHKFMENHLRYANSRHIVAGKRLKLGPQFSNYLRSNIHLLPVLEKSIVGKAKAEKKNGARFIEEGYYFGPESIFGFIPRLRKISQLKGCNMSFHKEAIEKINGFDEDYILPAIGEDIDLTWRFKGVGYTLFSVRNLAVQYHLHHRENWTEQSINHQMMTQKMMRFEFICKNGLVKLGES
jgi:cellulose synthase/poly-beta-1,6-N-acetylglucosamine synthase-like glycosyltransferase